MTVGELKIYLDQFPESAAVMMPGYEGGLEDMESAMLIKVKRDQNTESYYGPHEQAYEGDEYDTEAILFGRTSD